MTINGVEFFDTYHKRILLFQEYVKLYTPPPTSIFLLCTNYIKIIFEMKKIDKQKVLVFVLTNLYNVKFTREHNFICLSIQSYPHIRAILPYITGQST